MRMSVSQVLYLPGCLEKTFSDTAMLADVLAVKIPAERGKQNWWRSVVKVKYYCITEISSCHLSLAVLHQPTDESQT